VGGFAFFLIFRWKSKKEYNVILGQEIIYNFWLFGNCYANN